MELALVIMLFIAGMILGFIACLSIITKLYYGGEMKPFENQMIPEDWIYDEKDARKYAWIVITRK